MTQQLPFAQELLHRALPPADADRYYEDRAVKRPLYLRPTSPQPSARAERRRIKNEKKEKERKRKALKPRPLSAAKKRSLGLLEIPKEHVKWNIYLPLHKLWVGYMRDILGIGEGKVGFVSPAGAGPILASADMHGALVEVVRSRCVSRVGVKGIVVRDSQYVFEVVTEGDKLKSECALPCALILVYEELMTNWRMIAIPKEHTWFRLRIPVDAVPEQGQVEEPQALVFEINGEQFQHRATDRTNKKYKMHYQPDI